MAMLPDNILLFYGTISMIILFKIRYVFCLRINFEMDFDNMKKLFKYVAPLLFLGISLHVNAAVNRPELSVDDSVFNFGKLFQQESASHVFSFSNSGSSPLVVKKVRSSCGCTAALASKKILQPGEQGEINVTFKSGKMKGHKTKSVFLHTNDPATPVFEFKITGEVIPLKNNVPKGSTENRKTFFPAGNVFRNERTAAGNANVPRKSTVERAVIVVKPDNCAFNVISEGISREKTLVVSGARPFKITGYRATSPLISASIQPVNNKEYLVIVKLSDKAARGRLIGSVVLFTDQPKQQGVIIRVSARVIPKEEAVTPFKNS